MNVSKKLQEDITSYIQYSLNNPEYEFEVIFVRDYRKNRILNDVNIHAITEDTFKDILQFLSSQKDHYTLVSGGHEALDISIQSKARFSKYRLSLNKKSDIARYCKTNKYTSENVVYGIKDKKNNSLIEEYNMKANLKYDTIVTDIDEKKSIDKVIENALKSFRYKKRFTFTTSSGWFKIDLSLVKSSTYNNYVKYFHQSGILNQKPHYELEIELNTNEILRQRNNKKTITNSNITDELYQIIGNLLQVISGSSHIMMNSTYEKIRREYLKITFGWDDERITRSRCIENPADCIIEVKPISLKMIHLTRDYKSFVSIRKNYTVTDKADGERYLLFINSEGKCFLINNRFMITNTGLIHTKVRNTIIDGEYITNGKDGTKLKLYAAFDIYFYNREDITKYPLMTDDKRSTTRYKILQTIMNDGFQAINKDTNNLIVKIKKFYLGSDDDSNSILTHSRHILDNADIDLEYKIDGLIFTPANLPVGGYHEKDKSKLFGRWNRTLKWKSLDETTIDFLLKTIEKREFQGEQTMYCKLYVGYNYALDIDPMSILSGDIDTNDKESYRVKYYADCYIPLKLDKNGNDKMYNIVGTEVHDDTIVECSYDLIKEKWMVYRNRPEKTQRYKQTGSISRNVNDYNTAIDVWDSLMNPITEEIISGMEEIEEELIQEKFTEAQVLQTDSYNTYYARQGTRQTLQMLPLNKFHNHWVKKPLYDIFKKETVKKGLSLMEIACGQGGDLHKWVDAKFNTVIGTDVDGNGIFNSKKSAYARLNEKMKEKESRIVKKQKIMFFQLDASKDWSEGKYIKAIDDTDLVSQKFAKVVFGHVKEKEMTDEDKHPLLPFLGIAKNQFDVVSMQFAIHYMFETDDTLTNFANNINMVMKKGGYFIGTTLDGYLVHDMLKGIKKNMPKDYKEDIIADGHINNRLVWSIKQKYDPDSYNKFDEKNPLANIGKKITVYIESIDQDIDEYLFDYDLLVYKLKQHNIIPVKSSEWDSLGITNNTESFKDNYDRLSDKDKSKIDKAFTPILKKYSFLGRWFIFKKY